MKTSIKWILCTLVLVGWTGCEEPPTPDPIIRPVRVEQVFASGGTRVRKFSGATRAGTESQLSFKVGGTVEELSVQVGEKIERGRVIARLDPRDYRLQVQQAQAGLDQARAEGRNATASYERVRALYENNNASKSDLDQARAYHESTKAGIRSAAKQLELAQRQLGYATLKAPFDCTVASVQAEVNENVAAGRPVVDVTCGEQLEVVIGMPEVLIGAIDEGEQVDVAIDAFKGSALRGTVVEVGISPQRGSTTYPVTVQLQKDAEGVRPGMAAEVAFTFTAGSRRERFLVPSHAVAEDREGRYVYVAIPGSDDVATVERRSVEVGELTSEGLEVFSGLSDGELLVTAGVSRIEEGQSVRLADGAI